MKVLRPSLRDGSGDIDIESLEKRAAAYVLGRTLDLGGWLGVAAILMNELDDHTPSRERAAAVLRAVEANHHRKEHPHS